MLWSPNLYLCLQTEPGYYADGKWGIRIESVVVVREVETPNNFGKIGYLGFERITMVGFTASYRFCVWQANVLCASSVLSSRA